MCCGDKYRDLKKWHQVLRWTMFIFNFLLFCVSAFMLAYACYLLNSKWELLSHDNNIIPVVMFIGFAVIMLLTTVGSLGSCNMSRGFLILYMILTLLCLALEITLIVVVATSNMDTQTFLENRWDDLSDNDKEWLESYFECCGLDDNPDYEQSYWDQCDSTTETYPYCLSSLEDWVQDVETALILIGVGLLIFQIGGVVAAGLLLKALKYVDRVREDSYSEYSYYNNNV